MVQEADCAIAPLKYRGKKNSGVYDRENRLIASSARVRGSDRVEGELDRRDLLKAVRDKRDAYYLGCGEKHYGHFLLEVLCRAWAWHEHGQNRVPVLQSKIPPFAKALFTLIPGVIENVKTIERPTRFRNMIVPGASFVIVREAYVEFKRLCERMADQVVNSGAPETEQPLYLSRTALDTSRRTLEGEAWLEQLLEREGFLVVRPETLPVGEQIALFNRHRWIVSAVGSACHTRVFSRRANNFVTITPGLFNQNHVLCDLLCEGDSHYVHALVKPDIGTDVGLESIEPLLIDPEPLLAALKKLGLVRASAAFDRPPPDLDDYKLRWIAAARFRIGENPPNAKQLRGAIADVTASLGNDRRKDQGRFGFLGRKALCASAAIKSALAGLPRKSQH